MIYIGFLDSTELWRNVSEHALNAVFALFEIIFPRTESTPFLHLIPLIVILGAYLGVAYITFHQSHFYVYDFLDESTHSKGAVAGYIMGILGGTIIVFLIIHFLIQFRRWLAENKFGMTGTLSHREARPNDAEKGIHSKSPATASNKDNRHTK